MVRREVWYAKSARKSRLRSLGLIGLALGVLLGVACDNSTQKARMLIHFSEPLRYRVMPGDDLAAVAARYSVTEADLVAWNSLETTTIELTAGDYRLRAEAAGGDLVRTRPGPRARSRAGEGRIGSDRAW